MDRTEAIVQEFPFPHRRVAGPIEKPPKKSTSSELLWAGCWRLGVVIVCVAVGVLVFHLAQGQPLPSPGKWVRTEAAANVTQRGDRFFLDIGMSGASVLNSVRTKHLENQGWSGVCAVPFPGDFRSRSCNVVSLPVGPDSGDRVRAPDCSKGLQGLMNMVVEVSGCPEVETTTVGIEKLLSIASAPKAIDYISLNTQGSELQILRKFPFDKHCVRAWAVRSGEEEKTKADMRHLFEVSQGCRVVVGGDEVWARCPCESSRRAPALPVKPSSGRKLDNKKLVKRPIVPKESLEINAAGKQRKGHARRAEASKPAA